MIVISLFPSSNVFNLFFMSLLFFNEGFQDDIELTVALVDIFVLFLQIVWQKQTTQLKNGKDISL